MTHKADNKAQSNPAKSETTGPRDTIRMLAATACIGYGFTEEGLQAGMTHGVDFIGADAGSMDPGPYYLGAGKPYVSEQSIERDLELLLLAARNAKIPLIIGSCCGGGGKPHLELTESIVRRLIARHSLQLKLAVIHAEPPRDLLVRRLREGRIHGIWPGFDLQEKTLPGSTRIVAMMGAEPLIEALSQGADVILAGRCSDSAIYAAIPQMRGFAPGLAWHLGKTIECGATIATPKNRTGLHRRNAGSGQLCGRTCSSGQTLYAVHCCRAHDVRESLTLRVCGAIGHSRYQSVSVRSHQ